MRRFLGILLAGALVLPIAPVSAASAKAGGSCTRVGQTAKVGGKLLVCTKVANRRIWKARAVPAPTPTPTPTPSPEPSYPPVVGEAPSDRVMAFYYAWYGNPQVDGRWIHWDAPELAATPPDDIPSDYFPQLGTYSSSDPAVVAQHMAWMRRAGVGVAVLSYWRTDPSGNTIKMILDMAQRYGIKVAFHLEPAAGRSATSIVSDVQGIVARYGDHPAFFKTTATSPWVTSAAPKPMFFAWSTVVPANGDAFVPSSYWAPAMDAIHKSTNALMISTPGFQGYGDMVSSGHFDGAYNYITIHLKDEGGFDWARSMPRGSLYIPSVAPGNSGIRIKYPDSTLLLRNDGSTYDEQWTTALGTGIKPDFVTVTSFNEWHEGSMIEPPRANYASASGRAYKDFGTRDATYYLDATARWAKKYVAGDFPQLTLRPVRITVTTTSDWGVVKVGSGQLVQPSSPASVGSPTTSTFNGSQLVVGQPIDDANAGKTVSTRWELSATASRLAFTSMAGAIGTTAVKVEVPDGSGWRTVADWTWIGTRDNGATVNVDLP